MSDKLERLKNLIVSVAVNEDIIKFGSKEHLDIIYKFENIESVIGIKSIKNENILKAISIIRNSEKLIKILNDDIGINIEELE